MASVTRPADPERWKRLETLFYAASELDEQKRGEFLDQACGQDAQLRAEVESLLFSSKQTLGLLQEPVLAAAQEIAAAVQEIPGPSYGPGMRIGNYELLRLLGEGGMGKVYLATRADDSYQQKVAIKLVAMVFGPDPGAVRRFRSERQILANLNHPNIARLLDGGVTGDGVPYLVMEYVDGITVAEYCRRNKLLINDRLRLFRKICSAIEYAHNNLVVHRDIKPGNILVTAEGVPKLLDFGIAKLLDAEAPEPLAQTHTTERLLTPEYAAPEQIRGEAVTTATDVYAMGVLLYELLAGKRPLDLSGVSPFEIARAICERVPTSPSAACRVNPGAAAPDAKKLKGDLDNVVLMAMRKEPSRRYASVAEFSSDVQAYLDGYPVRARSDNWTYRSMKFVRRHKTGVSAAMIALLALIAFSVAMAVQVRRADRERLLAERESQFLAGMFQASTPEEARGKQVTARDLLDRGAQRIDRELASEPGIRASLLATIGGAYRNLGLYDLAQQVAQKSFAIDRTQDDTLELMAELERDKGLYAKAEPLLRQLVDRRTRSLGPNALLVAGAIGELGECLYWEAKDDEAIAILRKALAIYQKIGPDAGPEVRVYLALALERKGGFLEAAKLLQDSVDISRRTKGADSPEYANALHNLASELIDMGNLREAEVKLREAVAIRRKVLGNNHPDLVYSLNNLGYVLIEEGKSAEAEPILRDAIDVTLKDLGPNHPRLAGSFSNMARVLQAKGAFEESAQYFDRAAEAAKAGGASLTWPMAQIVSNQGMLAFDQRDYATAERGARQAMEMRRKLGGEKTPAFANSLIELAEDRVFQGDATRAEALLRQALAVRKKTYWPGHPAIVAAEVRLGEDLLAIGKPAEAESLFQQASAAAHHSAFPWLPWQIGEADSAYGACLETMGRAKEAEKLLRASRDELRMDPRPIFREPAGERLRVIEHASLH
ncbi:MAG TPA: serine/threonine-protein kinase [Bryobacteraceae bacterium]|nr:serine/threonine-protein kinase [Bryobacteraceae bacterium]